MTIDPCAPKVHTAATLRRWAIWRGKHPGWVAPAQPPADCGRPPLAGPEVRPPLPPTTGAQVGREAGASAASLPWLLRPATAAAAIGIGGASVGAGYGVGSVIGPAFDRFGGSTPPTPAIVDQPPLALPLPVQFPPNLLPPVTSPGFGPGPFGPGPFGGPGPSGLTPGPMPSPAPELPDRTAIAEPGVAFGLLLVGVGATLLARLQVHKLARSLASTWARNRYPD